MNWYKRAITLNQEEYSSPKHSQQSREEMIIDFLRKRCAIVGSMVEVIDPQLSLLESFGKVTNVLKSKGPDDLPKVEIALAPNFTKKIIKDCVFVRCEEEKEKTFQVSVIAKNIDRSDIDYLEAQTKLIINKITTNLNMFGNGEISVKQRQRMMNNGGDSFVYKTLEIQTRIGFAGVANLYKRYSNSPTLFFVTQKMPTNSLYIMQALIPGSREN